MRKICLLLILSVVMACDRPAGEAELSKTLMVKASGQDEFVPDMARFQVMLECLKSSPVSSKTCLVEKSNELEAKLKEFGISEKDILTTNVKLEKQYTWRSNSRVFQGYKASSTLIVTVRDLDAMDKIYTDLLDDENTNLYGLSYEHSKIDSLKNEVYLKALDNANMLANRLISRLPEENLEILQIGNVELTKTSLEVKSLGRTANYMDAAEEVQAESASISFNRGTIPVRVNIFVEYLID